MIEIRQYELREADSDSYMVCWLPTEFKLKNGDQITLKEIPNRRWTVRKKYNGIKTVDDVSRRWHVGGL